MDITSRGKKEYPPRILKYRKSTKFAGNVLKLYSVCLFLMALITISLNLSAWDGGERNMGCVWTGITIGITGLILYLEYLFLFKPLIISKIQVYKDKIFISRGKKEITIPFNEVIEIAHNSRILIRNWFTIILNNKKKYRFKIDLERVDYILDALIQFNPDLMEKDKYEKLRKHLVLSDHSQAWAEDIFGKRYYGLMAIFPFFLLPLSFSILLFYTQSNEFIIYSPFSYILNLAFWSGLILFMLWFMIFHLIADVLITKSAEKRWTRENNKKRDTSFEHKVFRKVFVAYICTSLIIMFGVYKTNLNVLGTTSLSEDADCECEDYLNIKPGEILWYDSRYNCISCNYSLSKGDVVVVRGDDLGKVIGFPNEMADINEKDKEGDFIADTKEVIIPSKSIALETFEGNRKVVTLVETKKIKGKIFKNIYQFFRKTGDQITSRF